MKTKTKTVKPAVTSKPKEVEVIDAKHAATEARIDLYCKRHGLTANARFVIGYLYHNGPSTPEMVARMSEMNMISLFHVMQCASGFLIFDAKGNLFDVNLTSRKAIDLTPSKEVDSVVVKEDAPPNEEPSPSLPTAEGQAPETQAPQEDVSGQA